MASRGTNARFFLIGGGVLVLHTLVTVLEESLFTNEAFLRDAGGAFMTLVMYSISVLWYMVVRAFKRRHAAGLDRTSLRDLLAVSTLYVGTTTLTKSSLRYIDMPTQTVLKSAKLLPVMLGSIVILRRSFSTREWLAALMLCSGIVVVCWPASTARLQGSGAAQPTTRSRPRSCPLTPTVATTVNSTLHPPSGAASAELTKSGPALAVQHEHKDAVSLADRDGQPLHRGCAHL